MNVTAYLQLQPVFGRGGGVREIKAMRLTQTRPESPLPGAAVVKLTLDVAPEIFEPLRVEAIVGTEDVIYVPAEVSAPEGGEGWIDRSVQGEDEARMAHFAEQDDPDYDRGTLHE